MNKKLSRYSLVDRESGRVIMFDLPVDMRTLIARVCMGNGWFCRPVGTRFGKELYVLDLETPERDENYQDWKSSVMIPKK